jgi:hypothetical protein
MPTREATYQAARDSCAEVGILVPDVAFDDPLPTLAMVVFARVWDQAVRDAAWGQPDYTQREAQNFVSSVLVALGSPQAVGVSTLTFMVADQAVQREVAPDLYGHPRQRLASCETCGLEFYPSRRVGERFCSSGCRTQALTADPDHPARTCLECGDPFQPKTNHPHSKYCSSPCRQRVHERKVKEDHYA